MTQSFYLGFYENFSRCFLANDYCAILVTVSKEDEKEGNILKLIREKKFEGIILLGKIKKEYIEKLSETALPMVLVDFYYDEVQHRCVLTDNIEGSYTVTNLLIKKGHKEIGFVGRIGETSSINDRYIGYYKAMFEHKLPINDAYIIPDRDEQGIYNIGKLPQKLPTAFVCNSDRAAYELYQQLKQRGLKVGEDISVVGFDDDIFARLCEPQLTTVAVNINKITKVAEEILISEIEHPTKTSGKISVPGTIIERQSIKDISLI
jgi:LacI family transcriptional regulator